MQLVAGIVMIGIAVSGITIKDENISVPVSDAEPGDYSVSGKWYTWSPAEHLSPKWSVEEDSLVLESKGSKNNIGKWAIELDGMSSEAWYRIGVSYKTENVAYPWESVIGVLSWFGEEHRLLQQD